MRRVLAVAWAIAAGPVSATDDWREKCQAVSNLAATVMERRQEGVSMADLMAAVDDDIVHDMIVEAYEQPRFGTDSVARTLIEDFRDQWYLDCVKSLKPE